MHYDSSVLEDSNRLQSVVQNSRLLPRRRSHVKFSEPFPCAASGLSFAACLTLCVLVFACMCALYVRAFACEMSRARKRMKSARERGGLGGVAEGQSLIHKHKHTHTECMCA